jgi:uncharacterized surface protein with fasciclin (FAS1) repeats
MFPIQINIALIVSLLNCVQSFFPTNMPRFVGSTTLSQTNFGPKKGFYEGENAGGRNLEREAFLAQGKGRDLIKQKSQLFRDGQTEYLGPKLGGTYTTNVVETLKQLGNFKVFINAVEIAGLHEVLVGIGPFSVFAPTDEAFSLLPSGNLDALLKDIPNLQNLLLFHIHPGKFNCTRNARTINTLMMGEDKFFKQLSVKVASWTEEVYMMTGQPNHAKVTTRGIITTNGLIHVLNEVLIPYEGNLPPQVTFMGARDIKGEETLQRGYYGPIAGTDRNNKKYEGPEREFVPVTVGSSWREGGNWEKEQALNNKGLDGTDAFDVIKKIEESGIIKNK